MSGNTNLCASRRQRIALLHWALRILVLSLAAEIVFLAPLSALPSQSSTSSRWTDFDTSITASQHLMMADPAAALARARAGEAIAKRNVSSPRYAGARATSLWLQAEALTRLNRIPEAQSALNNATDFLARNHKLSKLDGDVDLTRARLANAGGDIALALKSYQKAHAVFVQLGILRSQSIALQGLGSLYDKAHDFVRAIRYYREASQVYSGDPALDLSAANNIGFALQQMGQYKEAIQDMGRALRIATALGSPLLEANILNNLAISNARLHNLAEAEREADRAIALLGKKDESGESRFAWGVKAEVAYQRGALALAADDVQQAFRGLDLDTTPAEFRDFHEIAFRVYRADGNLPLAIAHLQAFKRLDDEGRSLASSVNLALMSAQFDFATQQLEIEQLKSAQLQRDISLRKSRETTLYVILVSLLLGGVILVAWITRRHALERRHRSIVAEKNRRLTQTLAELRLAMEAALQASRAKSHFLANMSHELRTPLNAIIGFSELMMLGGLKPEKLQAYASMVADGGRRLLAILNDILDMARLEAGKLALKEDDVRIGHVVNQTIAALASDEAAQRNIRFGNDNRQVCVRGDEIRLRQILANLLSNAVKFTSPGGSVDIAVERTSHGVDLVVRDNGRGIEADKIATIMEPFGQAESAYARAHGGAGLGLPIVKSLTELHGGRFTITSVPGEGTEARVHLPGERVMPDAPADASVAPVRALRATA
ncbi:MAG TPA: ATP-binding protein [Rhizomicrobium sp.]|nr:ATP-binding protein [Rhizomicrobium sp.]